MMITNPIYVVSLCLYELNGSVYDNLNKSRAFGWTTETPNSQLPSTKPQTHILHTNMGGLANFFFFTGKSFLFYLVTEMQIRDDIQIASLSQEMRWELNKAFLLW